MKLKLHFLILSMAMLGLWGCNHQDMPLPNDHVQIQADGGGGFSGMYDRNKVEILDNLDILTRAFAQLITDEDIATVVHDNAENQPVDSEYMVTITELKAQCDDLDIDLAYLMAQSLTACGGTAQQLTTLSQIQDGFTIEGFAFQPTIYIPQLDQTEFPETEDWDGIFPEYCGSIAKIQGEEIQVYDEEGDLHGYSEADLRTHPTWFLSFAPIAGEWDNDDSPFRFWHMCQCKYFEGPNGGGYACRTDGDGLDCGRTTFFGRNCPGAGGILCGGQ